MPIGPTYYASTNQHLARKVQAAVQAAFPLSSKDGSLRLEASDVHVDVDAYAHSLNAHQDARENGKTLSVPITAGLTLYRGDKKVQSLSSYKLGDLPMMTSLGTFMVNGNDYYTPQQLQLKPGVYTREMANGDYESFINVRGRPMRVWMEKARGILKLEYGSSNVDLYPILRALGATDAEIQDAFGSRELLEKNKVDRIEPALDKLYTAIFDRKQNRDLVKAGIIDSNSTAHELDTASKSSALRDWFGKQAIDSFVTKRTLGSDYSALDVKALLATAKKLLGVSRGKVEPDDRDALEFKKLRGVDDMMAERITKLTRGLARRALLRLGKPDTTIAKGLGKNWLNSATVSYFGGTGEIEGGMANTAEAANPIAILSEQSKVTLIGEGGIGDDRAITNSARLFKPTAANFIDPVHTVEGAQVGVTTHLTVNAEKTDDNKISSIFYKVEDGKITGTTNLTVEEASEAVVGYPESWETKIGGKPTHAGTVRANVNGQVTDVDPKTVQYLIPSAAAAFDHTTNSALFLDATHANRAMMAGKHVSQALPLVHREAPLSDLKFSRGSVFEEFARPFVIRSPVAGTVTAIAPDFITVTDSKDEKHKVEIFDHYPMQAKVAIHHTPVVKVGDKVKKDQLLADNNYSKDGKLALGVNLHSAYLPWKNASNYEDAIVISDSAAKKLSSDHFHRIELALDSPNIRVDKKLVQAQYPSAFTAGSFQKLDDTGVIKEGQKVSPGDVLIAAVEKRTFDEKDRSALNLSGLHKMLDNPYKNKSVVWDEIFQGDIYRVVRLADKIEVHIKTAEPIQVGDKLSMSSAAKGTVAAIIEDAKMPRNKDGNHIEVIFNPHGVAGRINPSQTIEQAVGKLVRKHGMKLDHAAFDGKDYATIARNELKKRGDSHVEKLFDPETGKWLERPVATGYNYVFKLDHPVRKKFSARERDGYTMDETPTRGAGKSGQSYDQLSTYALLGHNAHALLGESMGIRGVKNDDYWVAYQAGENPPPPKVPFVFEKFRAFLAGAGVDTKLKGDILSYVPMTDKSTLERSAGEITKATMMRARGTKALDIAEEKDGLFDVEKTGGVRGDQWSHIQLAERMPHPLFEDAIRDVAGLKGAEYLGLIAHTMHYDPKTKKIVSEPTDTTLTGEKAFNKILDFDPGDKLDEFKLKLKTSVGSDKNKYHRATRYLRGLEELKMKPTDAYMTSVIPVIPPKFRPILEMRGGDLRVADSNFLYRDVILANEQLKRGGLPGDALKDARVAVYKSVGAMVGVNNSLTHRDDREDAKGFIDVIKGKQNKEGLFQRMLARRRNDYTGRSTIEPDATLGPDEIGLPEDMAWKIFKPKVVRRMVRTGWNPADAMEEVENRTMAARGALDQERAECPIIYNRSPSLHRWSMGAAFASIHAGKDIKISPAVLGPFNADYDGDTMSVTVPISDQASKESHELLPTKNLFYDRDKSIAYSLDKDVISGLFALTRPGPSSGQTFDSIDDALAHFDNNKSPQLQTNSLVTIKGEPGQSAVGWLMLRKMIPARFLAGVSAPIDGKKLNGILETVAKTSPGDYNMVARRLAQLGFNAAATIGGITSSVDELAMNRTKVKQILEQIDGMVKKGKTIEEKRDLATLAMKKYYPDLNKEVADHLAGVDHGYHAFLQSRMSGKINPDQFRQMLVSPVFVKDVNDRIIPSVIRTGFGEGMRLSDFIMTTPGARKGMVDKSLATAMPGALAKEISANVSSIRITEVDCGTTEGVTHDLHDSMKNADVDVIDRHLLRDVPGIAKRNDPVTPEILAKMKDKGMDVVWVRSPMTCKSPNPPCQMCAGRAADGMLHPIGSNIGLNYGQTMSERSTQTILKSFHSGGTAGSGGGLTQGFSRLRELLSDPETIKGQGTLSDVTGTVSRIRPAPQGGFYVYIQSPMKGEVEQYVQTGRKVTVHAGDRVSTGDELSDGSFRPSEIAAKRGMLDAQKYVVDNVRQAFQNAGSTVRKPVIEVVVAGMMRYVEITNDGGEHDLAVGDIMHENEFEHRHAENPKIESKPYVPGLSQKPIETSKDLLERLNFQRIEDAIREAPATAGKSDITGSTGSPLAGFAYGARFREGQGADILKHDSAFTKETL